MSASLALVDRTSSDRWSSYDAAKGTWTEPQTGLTTTEPKLPPSSGFSYTKPEAANTTSFGVRFNASTVELEHDATAGSDLEKLPASSQLLAEWHGQVMDILEDSFTAQLRGRHGRGIVGQEDDALIPIEDVRNSDLELLKPGAFFSLCIKYDTDVDGSKRRYAQVIFRRMPAYRREELESARSRARELVRGFRLE